MTLSTWLLYVAAVFVLTVTPGPSVFMAISTSVEAGPRRAVVAALGSTTVIVGIMVLSMLGLGTALAASETLFTVLKWLGAAYLAWLGLSSLLARPADAKPESPGTPAPAATTRLRQFYVRGLLVGASNPKALLFFGALFPQFIDPTAPQAPQFAVLGLTFVCFEMGWLLIYAFSAARARRWLGQPGPARWFRRANGVVFLAAAGLVATSRRGT